MGTRGGEREREKAGRGERGASPPWRGLTAGMPLGDDTTAGDITLSDKILKLMFMIFPNPAGASISVV